MSASFWLVGAGRMSRAYAAVLQALGIDPVVICRSEESAARFTADTGIRAMGGGLRGALETARPPTHAIVAIDIGELENTAAELIGMGCSRLLIEKPGATNLAGVSRIADLARAHEASAYVAYNRRFYSSVLATRLGLAEDGGAVSMTFDFTEAADAVVKIGYPAEILDEWLLANSTHVIDTAFFLAGEPADWSSAVGGSLPWHPRAARFAGHGATTSGALFSYMADWDAPGRWSVEISSRKRRFILKPMEQLQIQTRGSFTVELQAPSDDLDARFKPGLYRQVEAFLGGENADLLPTIGEHRDRIARIYAPMLLARSRGLA